MVIRARPCCRRFCRRQRNYWRIADTTPTGSGRRCWKRAWRLAFRRGRTGNPGSTTIKHYTDSATKSKHVRKTQGLEAYRHALQPMRSHLLLRHLYRCNPHLLSQLMSPKPSRIVYACEIWLYIAKVSRSLETQEPIQQRTVVS